MIFENRKARSLALRKVKDPAELRALSKIPLKSVQNRAEKAKKAAKHKELCEKHGEMIRKGEIRLWKAIVICNISTRQMQRYHARAVAKFNAEVMNNV